MTTLHERIIHWLYGEQNRARNLQRQGVRFTDHSLVGARASFITTYPPIDDPTLKWGVDIAGVWDGVIDAKAFRLRGGSFVIVKACDGTIEAKLVHENCYAVRNEGLGLGLYNWLYPERFVSTKAQGQKWGALAVEFQPDVVFIDYEWTMYGNQIANPFESDLLNAALYLQQQWRGPLGVYSAPGYLSDHPLSDKCRFLLWWIAQYGVPFPSSVRPFGVDWSTWQQSDRWAPAADWGIDPNWAHASDGDVMTPQAYYSIYTGSDPDPDPEPDPSDVVTHPFPGVTVTEGRRYGSSFRLTAVERTRIAEEHITAPGAAHTVEEIEGDVVSNGGDFNMTTYQAVGLLRSEGREYSPQADSEPALAFDGSGNAWIDHRTESWWTDALGLKRYLVLDGAISPNTSPAWDGIEPRTIFGLRLDGTRLILNVAGRAPDQVGITLYQAAAIMIEFGADRAADGDGGDSVQSRVGSAVFLGTTQRRAVADFYTIKISIGGTSMTTKGVVKAQQHVNVKAMQNSTGTDGKYYPAGTILASMQNTTTSDANGDVVYGDPNPSTPPTDLMNFTHFYRNGVKFELPVPAKVSIGAVLAIFPNTPEPGPEPPPDTDDFFTANFNVEIINNETGARYTGLLTGKVSKVA